MSPAKLRYVRLGKNGNAKLGTILPFSFPFSFFLPSILLSFLPSSFLFFYFFFPFLCFVIVCGKAFYCLGSTYTLQKNHVKAIDYHEQHLTIATQLNDKPGMLRAWLD
jgi:hypothetical protein